MTVHDHFALAAWTLVHIHCRMHCAQYDPNPMQPECRLLEEDNCQWHDGSCCVKNVLDGCHNLWCFSADEERGKLRQVHYCDYAPAAVLENPGRFHYMMARDPRTGSFSDYDEHFGPRKQHGKLSLGVTGQSNIE
jgi:hypothetical protein